MNLSPISARSSPIRLAGSSKTILQQSNEISDLHRETRTRVDDEIEFTYYGIIGLMIDGDYHWVGDDIVKLRPVRPAPSVKHVLNSVRDQAFATALIRYAPSVSLELCVENVGSEEWKAKIAYTMISLLRLRAQYEFLVPAWLDQSWINLFASPDRSVNGELLDDLPSARTSVDPSPLTPIDVEWAVDHMMPFIRLIDSPQFALAISCYCGSISVNDSGTKKLQVWQGLEALVESPRTNVTDYVSRTISAIAIADPNKDDTAFRKGMKFVKKLYDVRSRLTHGGVVPDVEIRAAFVGARSLLRTIIVKRLRADDEIEAHYEDTLA